MEVFKEYLDKLSDRDQMNRLETLFAWILEHYPQLSTRIAWNQPMFTDHGAFILGFSVAKNHLAVTPEKVCLDKFSKEIDEAGYHRTQMLFHIPWQVPVNYPLLAKLIEYNIQDKIDCTTFWRK